jgi:hypothetical protein
MNFDWSGRMFSPGENTATERADDALARFSK